MTVGDITLIIGAITLGIVQIIQAYASFRTGNKVEALKQSSEGVAVNLAAKTDTVAAVLAAKTEEVANGLARTAQSVANETSEKLEIIHKATNSNLELVTRQLAESNERNKMLIDEANSRVEKAMMEASVRIEKLEAAILALPAQPASGAPSLPVQVQVVQPPGSPVPVIEHKESQR